MTELDGIRLKYLMPFNNKQDDDEDDDDDDDEDDNDNNADDNGGSEGSGEADGKGKKVVYYTYRGSLTTPPCYESVRWIVFKDIIKMSNTQVSI